MKPLPEKAVRIGFGEALVELAVEFPHMIVLDADIGKSLRTDGFRLAYPGRHINFGVAEQEMLAAAAGLATTGKIPIACTYAAFATMRACEQIRTLICYPHLNVKIACSHGGIEVGWDGPTHQAIEDLAIMRAFPNMSIICPADAEAVKPLFRIALEHEGPVYFRMGRNPVPVIYDKNQNFSFGKAVLVRDGNDITLVSTGAMLSVALQAAEQLNSEGITVRILDMHTIKPLDTCALEKAARETRGIVTMEDHNIIGGLGGAVAEFISEVRPTRIERVGVRDTFAESGAPNELYAKYHLDEKAIVEACRRVLNADN